jgi:hypothetical protein
MDWEGRESEFRKEFNSQFEALFSLARNHPYGLGEFLCTSLLHLKGPVIVSGEDAGLLCRHPHVFQKVRTEGDSSRLLLCHLGTCGLPHETLAQAIDELRHRYSIIVKNSG